MKVAGIQAVVQRLKRQPQIVARKVETGLKRAGLFIIRESMPLVPVLTGNLRGSWFCTSTGEGFNCVVRLGYSASYALFVHENLDARHKPGKQAKFLEQPARDKAQEIRDIIKKAVQ